MSFAVSHSMALMALHILSRFITFHVRFFICPRTHSYVSIGTKTDSVPAAMTSMKLEKSSCLNGRFLTFEPKDFVILQALNYSFAVWNNHRVMLAFPLPANDARGGKFADYRLIGSETVQMQGDAEASTPNLFSPGQYRATVPSYYG